MQEDPFFSVPDEGLYGWLRERRDGWQFGETGLIDAILERIGEGSRYFFEGGAGDGEGLPLTCQRLVDRGWRGDLYECDPKSAASLRNKFGGNPRITVHEEKLMHLCGLTEAQRQRSVYVIDVDSYDWWLFASLLTNNPWLPELAVVEHFDKAHPLSVKPCLPPVASTGKPMDATQIKAQASSDVLALLARGLYTLVCTTRVNSFFVRQDLAYMLVKQPKTSDAK